MREHDAVAPAEASYPGSWRRRRGSAGRTTAKEARRVRLPIAYLGGMRALRRLDGVGTALCVCVSGVFAWRALTPKPLGLPILVMTCLAGILFVVVIRLRTIRWIVLIPGGWLLVPLLGSPQPMPRIVDVYQRGDDVVAVGIDGRTIVLGIDPFPFRDAEVVRSALVAELRRRSLEG